MNATEQLSHVLPGLTRSVRSVQPMQMNDPTPCSELSVHGVIDHMIVGGTTLAHLFRGQMPPEVTPPAVYGWVPVKEFEAAMDDLLEAVAEPGALERTIPSPIGEVSGDELARFVAFDGLIHGWDLAVATGRPYDPPADVVDAVDRFARATVTPEMRAAGLFAEATTPPEGAGQLEGLVAFSGRTV